MNVQQALPLLGGLSPATFMRRHWQKKPLVIRQAIPGFQPVLNRAQLFEMAAREEVESRLVVQKTARTGPGWQMRHGPFERKSLPPLKQAGWTLLLQGMDLHHDAMHALLNQFRFVPAARLDDLMVSYASDGGGVGPHFDSYDVFLLQAHGRRRWRIGKQKDLTLQQGVPLKILANFEPEEEFVLEAGDMLYLPPRYAHDGIAEGECMTYSIGFRAPGAAEVAQEVLQRLAEGCTEEGAGALYRDPNQVAVERNAEIPQALEAFARSALEEALKDPLAMARALGEHLSEPKANVWFEDREDAQLQGAIRLDRRTRMLYDPHHVFINGEGFRASGRDAKLMRQLADARMLDAKAVGLLSGPARDLVQEWMEAGWLHDES